MNRHSHILIIGGGLAGLTSAIHLARADISVSLIEKNTYPKHKVCGEYISNEIRPYFEFLDIDIDSLYPIKISEMSISTTKGNTIKSKLPLGGFGISRYTLDHYLWGIAKRSGVHLINDQVMDVQYDDTDTFQVTTAHTGLLTSDYVIGAYGKRSILDKNLNRDFSAKKSSWLAVKSHYKADFKTNMVALHNFEGGYCGLSKVEANKVNVCYLVNYKSFKKHKSIDSFQREVMCLNPHLKNFFEQATPIFDKPITISQINFDKKKAVENHIFMAGDAAGLIHPLCGNGMAMAIQSAQILCRLLVQNYKTNHFSRRQIEKQYLKEWNSTFAKRLYAGRVLQKILLYQKFQEIAQKVAQQLPFLVPKIIEQTHGKPLVC